MKSNKDELKDNRINFYRTGVNMKTFKIWKDNILGSKGHLTQLYPTSNAENRIKYYNEIKKYFYRIEGESYLTAEWKSLVLSGLEEEH